MTATEILQERLRNTLIVDRQISSYELKLKEAIESCDKRIRIDKIQVRHYYKQDFMYSYRKGRNSGLLFIFSFYCPCGELRYEGFNIQRNWKQPQELETLCKFLRENTAKHLVSEGLL